MGNCFRFASEINFKSVWNSALAGAAEERKRRCTEHIIFCPQVFWDPQIESLFEAVVEENLENKNPIVDAKHRLMQIWKTFKIAVIGKTLWERVCSIHEAITAHLYTMSDTARQS
jgi:hypothetical protein